MRIKDVVSFHEDRYFDGAVQLGWVDKRKEQAKLAAQSFVFHGPKYHGASGAVGKDYQLKDTASFTLELLNSIHQGISGEETNPYWLVVAGYGSGKSHLAVTCSELLNSPQSATSKVIAEHVIEADNKIGTELQKQLSLLSKPALILPLDGMAGFHLGNALNTAVYRQLESLGIDAEPIRVLSPRFKTAAEFVERNYSVRLENFDEKLKGLSKDNIVAKLSQNDEDVYSEVDSIYVEANGCSIPIEGQESAQELIDVLSNVYCGNDGHFSSVVIIFDEFGRYLEYAGDKPHLAGDSALQQIFQGVQDNSSKIRFVGFIQYELKEYLKRFSGSGIRQLQRYITRFESAEKFYLSTNMETIFAHMIGKDESVLSKLWGHELVRSQIQKTHLLLNNVYKQTAQYPVWSEFEKFEKVVAHGCWPLHPLTVWFLSRQKDIVQSRSALSFIKEAIVSYSEREVCPDNYRLSQISAAELVLNNMLPELIAAERESGGVTAETVHVLLERFSAHINENQKLTLVAVAVLEKSRVGKQQKDVVKQLLSEATTLERPELDTAIDGLAELGALEWNSDLGKYELLSDGASRAQFQQWLRVHSSSIDNTAVQNLFVRRAAVDIELTDIGTDFDLTMNIRTGDWFFQAYYAHSQNIENIIKNAFKDWDSSKLPKESKGKVIYLYLDNETKQSAISEVIAEVFKEQLTEHKQKRAPIWVVGIDDDESLIAEKLSFLYLLDEKITAADSERYRRFIPEEKERCKGVIREVSLKSLKKQIHWIAGFKDTLEGRNKHIAKAIFSEVYNETIPYPFDGFTTASGKGPKLNSDISRALIARQVNGPWVQSQNIDIRNRCNSVLAIGWQALNKQGKLTAPKNKSVLKIFDWMHKMHESEKQRTLFQTYSELIKPPYGLNSSSASLLIGVFIGADSLKRIEISGEFIATSDWLAHLYKGTVKNYFNEETLKLSKVRFFDIDDEARWRLLLDKWESELHYLKKVELQIEANSLFKDVPIPENLEPLYHRLSEKTEEISIELNQIESKLDGLGISIEKIVRNNSVGSALSIGGNLIEVKNIVSNINKWPESLGIDCDEYLSIIQLLLKPLIEDWINRQPMNCTNATQVSDFRRKMGVQVNNMTKLGFVAESSKLSSKVLSTIHKVEALQKIRLTLDECQEYPRQAKPNKSMKVRTLRDQIARGESLILSLVEANDKNNSLTEEEVTAIIKQIRVRQEDLRAAETERKNEMSILFQRPNNRTELNTVLEHANSLMSVFLDTRDEIEINEIIIILSQIIEDVDSWKAENLSPERAQEILSSTINRQYISISKVIESEEIEPPWDVKSIYVSLLNNYIKYLNYNSKEWVKTRELSAEVISILPQDKCYELLREFESAPQFLNEIDKIKLQELVKVLKNRLNSIIANNRVSKINSWMHPLLNIGDFQLLSLNQAKALLQDAENPPESLTLTESTLIEIAINDLKGYLDQLDAEDLITRLKKLPKQKLRDIYQLLSTLLTK
jgi:hypothetical protein